MAFIVTAFLPIKMEKLLVALNLAAQMNLLMLEKSSNI
jgi:hypothetical protein